jgi:hypothetical protein
MKSGWQKYKFPVLPMFRLRTTKEEKCPSVTRFVLKFIIITGYTQLVGEYFVDVKLEYTQYLFDLITYSQNMKINLSYNMASYTFHTSWPKNNTY